MNYQIVGKNLDITEAMRNAVISKLETLEKYLKFQTELDCRVVIIVNPSSQKIEVTIPTKVAIIRAEVTHSDFYAALDLVVDKIEKQFRKMKSRLNNRKTKEHLGNALAMELIADEKDTPDQLVRTKAILVEPLELDEAVAQMELSDHSFFIYQDIDTLKVNVLYRRNDGALALIEVGTTGKMN